MPQFKLKFAKVTFERLYTQLVYNKRLQLKEEWLKLLDATSEDKLFAIEWDLAKATFIVCGLEKRKKEILC
ncbi:MAG: hypothetical protein ACTS43_00025 [Candidatus Hodgkinia cicadicola]